MVSSMTALASAPAASSTGVPTAVDLDGQVQVLAGPVAGDGRIRCQQQVTLRGVDRCT